MSRPVRKQRLSAQLGEILRLTSANPFRWIAGAVLDVFVEEPLPADSPWWDAPNVIVTPHASGVTLRYFDALVVENVRRYLAGAPLLNRVDPERGY